MGREGGGTMLGGGVVTDAHAEAWDHVSLTAETNVWHHVAMLYDSEKVHFYLDGNQQPHATKDAGDMVVNGNPVFIGQAGTGTDHEFFEGLVDEVKLYTRVLLEEEVADACGCPILRPPPPPPPAVASGDLDAFWSFDSSTVVDETGNGFDGTWEGTEAYEASEHGMAAHFDGASRIVVSHFANFAFGDHFSVSLFFKRTGGEGNYQGIVNNGYYSSGSFEIRMGREMGGEALGGGVLTDAHAEAWDHVGINAKLNEWHHVAMVYDDAQLHFYVDGHAEAHASNDHGDMVVNDTPVVIGQAGPGSDHEFFEGLIDEVKLWTRGLAPEEVATECGCDIVYPPPSAPPGVASGKLELHLSFDASSPTDSSEFGRDGVWIGAEQYGDGKMGAKAALFDGSSLINVNSFVSFIWGDRLTVSLFFKRTGGEGNYQGIVNNGYYSSGSFEIRMGREMGGEMLGGGVITTAHAEAWDHVGINAKLNEWHHVAMVYNDEQLNFWLDGTPEDHASNDSGSLVIRDNPVVIGQAGPGSDHEYFEGLIDEVKLYTKALSVEELATECGGCVVAPSPPPPPPPGPPPVGDCSIISAVQTIDNGAAVNGNSGLLVFDFAGSSAVTSPKVFDGVKCQAIEGHEDGQHDEIVAVELSRPCSQSSFAVYGADRSVPETDLRHVRVAYSTEGTNGTWTCWVESDAAPQEGASLDLPQTDCSTYGATHMPSGSTFLIPGPAMYVEFAFWGRTDVFEVELVSCDSASVPHPPLTPVQPRARGERVVEARVSVSNAANDMLSHAWADATNLAAPQVFDGIKCQAADEGHADESSMHDDIVAVKLSAVCGSSSFAVFGRDQEAADTDIRHVRVAYSLDGSSWSCYVQSTTPSVGGTPSFTNPSHSCGEGPSHAQSGAVFNIPFPAQYVEFAVWGQTEIFEVELMTCDIPPTGDKPAEWDAAGLPRTGACNAGYVGGEAQDSLDVCKETCTAHATCNFVSYCPAGGTFCVDGHTNMCARYTDCPGSDQHSSSGSPHSSYTSYGVGDNPPNPNHIRAGEFSGIRIKSAKLSADNAAGRMLSWPYADGEDAAEAVDGFHDPIGGHPDGQHDDIVAVKLTGACASSSFAVFGKDRDVAETDLRHARVAYSMDGSSWTCYTQSYYPPQAGTPPFNPASDSCAEGPSHAPSGAVFNVPFPAQYVEFAFWGITDVYEVRLESCDANPPPPPPPRRPVNGISIQEARISVDDQAYNMLSWNFAAGIPTNTVWDGVKAAIGGHENGQHDDIVAVHLSGVCASSSFAVYGKDRSAADTDLRHVRVAYSLGGTAWTCYTQSHDPAQVGSFATASDACSEGPSHAQSGTVFNVPFAAEFVEFAFVRMFTF
jgi:hypothetical protein